MGGRSGSGRVSHLLINPVNYFHTQHMTGVIAETPEAGLLGLAAVGFGQCQYEGEVRDYALLSNLAVPR